MSKCYEKSAPASPATARKAGGGVVVTVRLGSSSVHLFQLLEAMSTAMCMASWGKDVSGPAVSVRSNCLQHCVAAAVTSLVSFPSPPPQELLRTAKEALEYVADHSLAGVHVRHSILNIIRYVSCRNGSSGMIMSPSQCAMPVLSSLCRSCHFKWSAPLAPCRGRSTGRTLVALASSCCYHSERHFGALWH